MPTQAPHRPERAQLTHSVLHVTVSPREERDVRSSLALLSISLASRRFSGVLLSVAVSDTRISGFLSIPCVSHQRYYDTTPPFPPQGPMGFVPLYHWYYEGATTSCFPSRRLSFPSGGDTVSRADRFVSCHYAPPQMSLHRRLRPGVIRSVIPTGI